MKKFLEFLPNAVIISTIAAILQCGDQLIGQAGGIGPIIFGGGWIAFQAWAVYFLAGSTLKGGIRALIGYSIGIIASICIFEVAGLLGGLGFFAVPLTLLILVIPIIYLLKAPELFSLVPAVFVGAGVFFGVMSYFPSVEGAFPAGAGSWAMYGLAALGILTYCCFGLIAGWLTITLQGMVPANKRAAAEAAAAE
ncbi:MAG: DUF1097 domain-containing protein [Propionibacteriaceae bacterium]|jgi:hypothetical protein|nr:DUF1097 domain-containing protein [Propionibacteriaceae bacterium]